MTRSLGDRLSHALAHRHGHTLAGILDQGVVGLGNLGMGLFVLHGSSKEQYGLYTLCYTTLILLNGFGSAVFAAQLTACYHDLPEGERSGFARAMLRAQAALTLPVSLAAAIVLFFLPASVAGPEIRLLLAVTALGCPGAMACDFLRGHRFVARRAWAALAVDAGLIAAWLAASLAFSALGLPAHIATLAGFGAAGVATAAAALLLPGTERTEGEPHSARAALATGWRHGRWALGGAAVTALQNQAHVYLLAWLATAEAVAELNAARILLVPMSLLILGVNRTLVPDLTRHIAEGRPEQARRSANRTLAAVLATIAAYVAVVVLGEATIIRLALGPRYADIAPLVLLWGMLLLLQAVDMNWSALLQAGKRFRELTLVNLWTVGPVLACAVPLILAYGARGNLIALAIGYVGMCLLLRRVIGRTLPAERIRMVADDGPIGARI